MNFKRVICGLVAAATICSFAIPAKVNAAENVFTGTDGTSASTSGGTISSGQTSDDETSSSDDSNYGNDTNTTVVSTWIPQTAEEKAIFSLVGAEPVKVETKNGNVNMINSVQGKLCYKVFKEMAGDYTIARTYSILPKGATINKPVYETVEPVTLTLNIPSAVKGDNRTYEMIGVTKNGVAKVYKDEDADPNTITFTTNHFYAYALCYKNK